MRVAIVAGSEAGHALPGLALALRLIGAGHEPVVFTGRQWREVGARYGVDTRELPGLAARPGDDDGDAGAKIHGRAAYIATKVLPGIEEVRADLVVADILTPGGGMAAELLGVPWLELSPHPLYLPSKGLPPIGSGLAPAQTPRELLRDAVLRAFTARDIRNGLRQRAEARAGIGLPARDGGPAGRLVATIPALELPRADWPARTHLVGPLTLEPTDDPCPVPDGTGPLVMVAPSTAATGEQNLAEVAVDGLRGAGVRLAVSGLNPPAFGEPWVASGFGRQDELVARADAVVCGGGHGMLTKALTAGKPVVVVPGGGDQWELANRVARQGSGVLVRPATAAAIRDGVRRVLDDPSYARAARSAADGAHRVADPVLVCEAYR
ncbi:Zeaxanthin glucosyltransferase (plasmid) [Tsukamurella tyrosinosolvens]|uniref:UDP:flavonoid glycosyltransferase YjiC, YdhE family n=1 Tax=Tsukamurella tyrosinosolvens TaxID=57704 RepID=A0A1H4S509_TSUTY|nr:nucleotide disphospho-sugar-binding domain-containing protein [Tsukamurella tyrosinosolvens]KXO93800.1 glycosyl transferase [Tsukamurella tyrosinosolvens]SEC39243.1 UDP:flavonoid glycosyltransferase YjiC, YdhE family [Tsukamurella tyrosinosolvens]VEH96339.1 Zeaxanthin glucosyltransferase [Tsukamurella tyrosinosolvens]